MRKLLAFFILLFVAVCIDVAWFALIANPYYIDSIGHLLRQTESGFSPDVLSAVAVYVLLLLGIIWFVLPRANRQWKKAARWGAVYGLIVYGIYDFTNYATLATWPLNICFFDLAWGVIYCGFLASFAVFLQKKFG